MENISREYHLSRYTRIIPTLYIYYRPGNNRLSAHTLRFSPDPNSFFRAHKLGSRPNRAPQRHPLSNHFGSRPNRTPMSVYSITTLVLARSEHPVLSAGVSGVGMAPRNSLHDFPVSPANITQNRCTGPARAVVFTPTSDTLTMQV